MKRTSRSLQRKIRLFRSLFSGLDRAYGTYDPSSGAVRIVKRRVTDNVIYNHLRGIQPYGVFLLRGNRIRAAVVDFDVFDVTWPLSFIHRAAHYRLPCYAERSKSKGYHVWMFFEGDGVLASTVRVVVRHVLNEIEAPPTEIFPKQDRLVPQKPYGNFINAPLFGALVPKGKTVFVDPENAFQPYPDQWDVLENVQRIAERQLDDIIEINQIPRGESSIHYRGEEEKGTTGNRFALPPCARAMLEQGVTEYQRVACFRLAVQLKRIGLPQDAAIAVMREWTKKNRPHPGKGIITSEEILGQVKSAYDRPYQSCGCEDPAIRPFCDASCPIFSKVQIERR
ncbi:MAG: hypothetical protein GC154_18595 [bacterium]|nr:hypothetical protein [bacterium]